jgi:hypothetical protein
VHNRNFSGMASDMSVKMSWLLKLFFAVNVWAPQRPLLQLDGAAHIYKRILFRVETLKPFLNLAPAKQVDDVNHGYSRITSLIVTIILRGVNLLEQLAASSAALIFSCGSMRHFKSEVRKLFHTKTSVCAELRLHSTVRQE